MKGLLIMSQLELLLKYKILTLICLIENKIYTIWKYCYVTYKNKNEENIIQYYINVEIIN